ncbi:PilZ domain-containing protein [Pseudomonas sp. TTU2014-080ASC]|uniref:PilZ domain-containing protein n=1 Tax=Pseudomonas sp. TTU2014-080ASC TaxID=1729724 RepID=UPI0007189366|nr:PilZ domain-containing protein [Pseudomonas sp. TTU2014-080ASC]KRW61919.1 pilus assembly protein PilZ [Pseudomonas sp. TTU2014-080ASC]
MRRFLRHPTEMPVELVLRKQRFIPRQRLHNISLGGIACNSPRGFRRGTAVEMRIPLFGPNACYPGLVAWSRKEGGHYLIGIAFLDHDTLFRVRMVEQVCCIEQFRRQLAEECGCPCDFETAARQWIEEHADGFGLANSRPESPL